MKTLKNLFKLSSKVEIYIPSTVKVDKQVSNKKQVDKALTFISECFGGATSTQALGSWVTEEKKLVKEKVTVVYGYCTTEQLEKHIGVVIEYCEKLREEMEQEAIALTINNEMYFI